MFTEIMREGMLGGRSGGFRSSLRRHRRAVGGSQRENPGVRKERRSEQPVDESQMTPAVVVESSTEAVTSNSIGEASSLDLLRNPNSSINAIDPMMLAVSAREAFSIFELWQDEKSFDHRLTRKIGTRIVKERETYCRAIGKSVENAQQGYAFAIDALDFCDLLLKAEGPISDLQRALKDIVDLAKKAHQGATEMQSLFRNVRGNCYEILKNIPPAVQSLTVQKNALKEVGQGDGADSVIASQLTDIGRNTTNEDEMSRFIPNGQHATQLARATDDLNKLISHVSCFVNWWLEIVTNLTYFEHRLPQLEADGSNPMRARQVREQWVKVGERYLAYSKEIRDIEDKYRPSSSEQSSCYVM